MNQLKDGHTRFKEFKRAHRSSMAATIDRTLHTSPNGASTEEVLQGIVDKPPWWKQYFKWENLTVAGRTIEKGWVVPQPLGIALLLVILGGVGSLYWRITDKQVESDKTATVRYMEQREMMIRLDQRFIDKEAHDVQERKQLKETQELHALQIQDLKDKLLVANVAR